jgi:choice-of-anchor C domain-containing protein
MKIRNALVSFVTVVGIVLSSGAGAANLVLDGDFSTPSGGTSFTTYTGTGFGPWNLVSGSVDLIGGYWQAPTAGGGSVDLDGDHPGAISQSIFFANPGNYALTFSLSGNPDGGDHTKTVEASIGGVIQDFTFVTGGNTGTSMNYVPENVVFTISGVGSQTLLFRSLDASGAYGPVIGNVAINAVPLPPALPLFGAALLGIAGFAFHRRRQAV